MIRSIALLVAAAMTLVPTCCTGEALAVGDAGRGRKVTEKWRVLCYAVAGAREPAAPPFAAIVRRSGRNDACLRDFLQSDHFPMTMYRLFDHEKEDVLDYFRSLRNRRCISTTIAITPPNGRACMDVGLSISSEVISLRNYRAVRRTATAFVIALKLQFAVNVHAKAEDDHLGIIEYEISCMPCHGIDGRGDGVRAKSLKSAPVDLTKMAKSNKGVFPSKKLADMIDGRATVAAHGQREMPVWGDRYRAPAEAGESTAKIERRARAQIAALVRYLKTIQEK